MLPNITVKQLEIIDEAVDIFIDIIKHHLKTEMDNNEHEKYIEKLTLAEETLKEIRA